MRALVLVLVLVWPAGLCAQEDVAGEQNESEPETPHLSVLYVGPAHRSCFKHVQEVFEGLGIDYHMLADKELEREALGKPESRKELLEQHQKALLIVGRYSTNPKERVTLWLSVYDLEGERVARMRFWDKYKVQRDISARLARELTKVWSNASPPPH